MKEPVNKELPRFPTLHILQKDVHLLQIHPAAGQGFCQISAQSAQLAVARCRCPDRGTERLPLDDARSPALGGITAEGGGVSGIDERQLASRFTPSGGPSRHAKVSSYLQSHNMSTLFIQLCCFSIIYIFNCNQS